MAPTLKRSDSHKTFVEQYVIATWIIAEKTFLRNILNSRFAISSVLVILLMCVSGLLMSREMSERLQNDYQRRSSASGNLEQIEAVKTPSPLAFIADGGESELPWTVSIRPAYVDTSALVRPRRLLIETFPLIDWVYVVAVIMSLAALFFSYDLVAGEKEAGLLAFQLSYSIRRSSLLLGSYLGTTLSFFPLLLIGLVANLLIILTTGSVVINADHLVRIGFIVLLALLYASTFVLVGLLMSSLFHQSAAALISGLMIWILLVIIIPQGSGAVAVAFTRLPTDQQLQREINRIREQLGRFSISSEMIQDIVSGPGSREEKQKRIDQLAVELEARYGEQKQKMERRIGEVIRDFSHKHNHQIFVARRLAWFSPAALFQFAATELCNTGMPHYWNFLENAQKYQALFVEYSDRVKRETRDRAKPVAQGSASAGGWTISVVFERDYSGILINPSALPVFTDRWPSLGASLTGAWLNAGLLMVINLVLFAVAYVWFLRYDVC
jgi:ABC-type transport system involved in multi-copper enzyme maturation permease subunit